MWYVVVDRSAHSVRGKAVPGIVAVLTTAAGDGLPARLIGYAGVVDRVPQAGHASSGAADLILVASTAGPPRSVEVADVVVSAGEAPPDGPRGLLARWPGADLVVVSVPAGGRVLASRAADGGPPLVVCGTLGDAVLCACMAHCWLADRRPYRELVGALIHLPPNRDAGARRLRITAGTDGP